MMRSILALGVGGLLALCVLPAQAQDAILGQMYGNGVHAYFDGDCTKAHRLLTSAIDAGSHDPRCYYFRGLAYIKLGRPQEADDDFKQGAKLETADMNKTYSVAKSLERVQGPARLELEQHRQAARMAALEREEQFQKQRYQQLNTEERRSLEEQVGPAPGKSGSPAPPAAVPPGDPFAAPEKSTEVPEKAAAQPAAEQPAEKGAAAPAKAADNSDPFAEKPEKPAAAEKVEKPAAAEKAEKPAAQAPAKAADEPEQPAAETPAAPAKAVPGKKGSVLGALGHAAEKAALGDKGPGAAKGAKKAPADKRAADNDAPEKPAADKDAKNPFGN